MADFIPPNVLTTDIGGNKAIKVDVVQTVAGSGTVTGNQGTPNTVGNAWPVKVTDGVDTALVSAAGALKIEGTVVQGTAGASPWPVLASYDSTSPLGSITGAGQDVQATVSNNPTTAIQIYGAWTGTLVFEASTNVGLDWVAISGHQVGAGTVVTSTTSNGIFVFSAPGHAFIRVRASAFSAGTAGLYIRISGAPGAVIPTTVTPVTDNGGSLTVDGTVGVSGSVAVTGPLTDAQLRAAAVPVSAASLPLPTGAATSALQTQPGVDIGDVTVNNASGGGAVNVQDGGNSLTVDGTVTVNQGTAAAIPGGAWPIVITDTVDSCSVTALGALKVDGSAVTNPISAASLPLPTGAATSALQTQPGVDIGDVTVNNAAGASAVNVQDGGNSLTVDGTVAVSSVPARVRTTDSISTALQTDAIMSSLTALTPKFAKANISASTTDGNIVSAVASRKLRVLAAFIVSGSTATDVTFNSKPGGAGTAISCLIANSANGGAALAFSPVGWFETVSGEGLTATTSSGSSTGINVVYVEVP